MTREEIHQLPWKAQEYINELKRKLTLTDVKPFFCCKDAIQQRCGEQCLGCYTYKRD
jgi:hypothetical protein